MSDGLFAVPGVYPTLRKRYWLNEISVHRALAVALVLTGTCQARASTFTSYKVYDAARQVVGEIGPDADGTGALGYPAVRYTINLDGGVTKTERGYLSSLPASGTPPSSWGSGFKVLQTHISKYDRLDHKTRDSLSTDGTTATTLTVTDYSYDASGRTVCTAIRMHPTATLPTDACALSTQSDGDNGNDRIQENVYDDGRLDHVTKALGTSKQQTYVSYLYTKNGQIEYITDANGNKARYAYDTFDRVAQWYFPNPSSPGSVSSTDFEKYGYDASDNRTLWQTRAGTQITYDYDGLNKLFLESRPGNDIHRDYDLLGRLTKVWFTSTTTVAYTWDNGGRKLTETRENGWQIKSTYDADGNRITIQHPDGQVFTYGYDGLDRMTDLWEGTTSGQKLVHLTYDQLGRRSALDPDNGNPTAYTYDAAGRLLTLFIDPLGSAYNVHYGFGYNPASEVKTRTRDNDTYAYDGYLNVSRVYKPNGLNQYTTAGSASLAYDADGNLTSDGANGYSYNEQRVLYHGMGSAKVDIGYDPTWRITTTSGGASGYTGFLWDGDQLVAEYDSSGKLLRRYVYGPGEDEPWMWYEGPTVAIASRNYLRADAEGSIIAVNDGNGNITHVNTYDEWGVPSSGNVGRFQYTGEAWLPDLRMYDYKARVYSPTLGRFLQTDPIGYSDQMNLYSYVNNDPVSRLDYTGQATVYVYDRLSVVVQRFTIDQRQNAAAFTPEQVATAIGHDLSGSDSRGNRVVSVGQYIPLADANQYDDVQYIRTDPRIDPSSPDGSNRAHTSSIGGRSTVMNGSEPAEVAAHEVGHGEGAGDQYGGGLDVNSRPLNADIPGPTNIMKNAFGPANSQTLDEIENAPTNRQVQCQPRLRPYSSQGSGAGLGDADACY